MKRTPLKVDLAKTAAFHQRGRAKGLKRSSPQPRVTTPRKVWLEVLRRDGGRCIWAHHLGERRQAMHPHHLLPKGDGGWPEFVAVRANIVGLSADAHMQHEFSPNDRLPWDALPAECREFLLSIAVRDPRAARLVSTRYPATGAQVDHPVRRGV